MGRRGTRVAVRRLSGALVLAIAVLVTSCGDTDPTSLDVRVTYVSRIVGCPGQASPCFAGCAHHNAPAGVRIVPLWQAEAIRLSTTAAAGRYEGVLTAVPTNAPLRLYATDPNACCVDACGFPPVVEDILLNGTRLTKVVDDGLPAGVAAALEFTLDGDGTIRN